MTMTMKRNAATISLCLAAITHTYLLFHCYPYLGYMSIHFSYYYNYHTNNNNVMNSEADAATATATTITSITTVDDAGLYAGLLGTAFTLGRCVSFGAWKALRHSSTTIITGTTTTSTRRSTTGGIKRSLLWSLLLSALCSLWFGMSHTFLSAILARFCLGLSNSISGSVKRGAIELEQQRQRQQQQQQQQQTEEEENEPEGAPRTGTGTGGGETGIIVGMEEMITARVLAVMHWGSVIGPLAGGILSNAGTYSEDTIVPDVIEVPYPFLLPNAVGALLCFISMITILFFFHIDDDNIDMEIQQPNHHHDDPGIIATATPGETQSLVKHDNSNINTSNQYQQRRTSMQVMKTVWKERQQTSTRWHLVAYYAFSFVVVCIDEALPLFLIARSSGPGLSPKEIGFILATAGFVMIVVTTTASSQQQHNPPRFGLYSILRLAAIMGTVPCVLFPFMLFMNGGIYHPSYSSTSMISQLLDNNNNKTKHHKNSEEIALGSPGAIDWLSFLFLILVIGCLRSFQSAYFTWIGVATSRTVPPQQRDDVARIMTHGALYARAVAPAIAGVLVWWFMSETKLHEGDAIALWTIIGLVLGLPAATLTFYLHEENVAEKSNKNRTKQQEMYLEKRQKNQPAYERLWEVYYKNNDKDSAEIMTTTIGSKLKHVIQKVANHIFMRNNDWTNTSTTPAPPPPIPQLKPLHHRRVTWDNHFLKPGIDIDNTAFFILGTSKYDASCIPHVLTPPLMTVLHRALPGAAAESNFWLKYSIVRDGASFETLESKIVVSKNTMVAIETLEGDVFGCFMAKPWKRTNRYERCGESFLWRMKHKRTEVATDVVDDEDRLDEIAKREGDIDIFPWTGENDECQLLGHDRMAAGGGYVATDSGRDGFGFIIENNLSSGSSSPCQTYGNTCLVSSPDGRFEVANMEVWCMTHFLFAADALKSESTLRFVKENTTSMSNLPGDAPSSAQSAWTNFL